MEQFIVSARKYRPATFATVVGQESVSNTLINAIKNNQLAQAFLFCGPRGVGKTTCARILAKALNAEDVDNLENEASDDINIFELDAASNSSVDDIRRLIEQVRIPPVGGKKYKTYIIDEVHMLSSSAFNAFLKTLEEPPAYAKFILATTEKHKILPTILSRCQIFDFQRIGITDMVNHLRDIAQKEGITAEEEALFVIAQKADGGLRDALSMFDQLATFTSKNLSYQAVIENLNILDYDYYFAVTQAIINAQIPEVLVRFNEINKKGFDGQHFINGLAEHFRNLLVCKDPQTVSLLLVGDSVKKKYVDQAGLIGVMDLIAGLGKLSEADVNYRMSKNQRLLVELTLMQLCSLQNLEGEKKNDIRIIAPAVYTDRGAGIPLLIDKSPKAVSTPVENALVAEPAPSKFEEVKNTEPAPERAPTPRILGIKAQIAQKNKLANDEVSSKDLIGANKIETPFTQEELEAIWEKYAQEMRVKKKESFYSTLMHYKPQLKANFALSFAIANTVQRLDFEREQSELIEFLRKSLNNYSIALELEQVQSEENTSLYADSDKLKVMMEKSEAIALLVKKFGLEPEF